MSKYEKYDYDVNDYDYWVQEYVTRSIANGKPLPSRNYKINKLPPPYYYINNCPDDNVNSWAEFVNWCGFFHYKATPIDRAIELIKNMEKQYNRPLRYNDFVRNGCYTVHINYIRNHWGNVVKMKKELGLMTLKQGNPDRVLNKQKLDNIVDYIAEQCSNFYDGNASFDIINSLGDIGASQISINKHCKKYYDKTLLDILSEKGLNVTVSGCGLVYVFDDGEKTLSQFEYLFSRLLRKNGFVYNVDYQRDVLYNSFLKCENKYTCDYVIKYNNRIIYIEIPGLIGNYKQYYYKDRKINTSRGEEKYKTTLKEKESLLLNNGLEYYLLFPSDLTQENLSAILNMENGIKQKIEMAYKNNIDWKIVRNLGELRYLNILGKDNQRIVDYEQKEAI